MVVKVAVFCDYAHVDESGRLTVVNAFSQLNVPGLPATYSRMYFVTWFTPSEANLGIHTFSLVLTSPSGKEILRFEGEMELATNDRNRNENSNVPVVAKLDGLVVEEYGEHLANFVFDGHHVSSVSLKVREAADGTS